VGLDGFGVVLVVPFAEVGQAGPMLAGHGQHAVPGFHPQVLGQDLVDRFT